MPIQASRPASANLTSGRRSTRIGRARDLFLVPAVLAVVLAGCSTGDNSERQGAEQDTTAASASTVYVDADGKCAGLQPCETKIQDGIDRAITDDADAVEVFDGTYKIAQTADPARDPALTITSELALRAYEDGDCPITEKDCPIVQFEGITTTGLLIAADDVSVEDLWFSQKEAPPSTPGGQLIEVPHKSDGGLYESVLINDVGFEGGRHGVRVSGSDLAVTGSYFTDQVSDSALVPTLQGKSVFQANYFEGDTDSRKAINFENQYQSPAPSGTVDVLENTMKGKRNFASWNMWPEGIAKSSVSYTVRNNTVVDSGGPAISFYSGNNPDQFALFESVRIDSNIVQDSGGNAVLVDYTTAGKAGGVPAQGQLAVTSNLLFRDTPSPGATNDQAGSIGFGFEPNVPAGASTKMFAEKGTIDGKDPQLGKAPLFPLDDNSPAVAAGSGGRNIGAWQGALPVVTGVRPSCTPAGKKVQVEGKSFQGATAVTFDGVPGINLKVKKDNRIDVTVPEPGSQTSTPVDVAVSTAAGTGVLEDGFRYPTQGESKQGCDK